MPCFTVLLRILAIISILGLFTTGNAVAQIACPAMAITQVNVNKKDKLAGFSKAVRSGKKKTQMGSFFTTKTKKSGRFKEYSEFSTKSRSRKAFFDKDEFAMRTKKKGRFRSYDEFATRSKRSKKFRDFDEFAYRSSKRGSFYDKDEFATKRQHHKRINIDSQFSVRSTEKRFNSSKRLSSGFSSKRKRSKQAKSEYTPFASTTSPFAGEKKHRDPQIGLWGGTVGNRSGKDKRKMIPLPEPEKKE